MRKLVFYQTRMVKSIWLPSTNKRPLIWAHILALQPLHEVLNLKSISYFLRTIGLQSLKLVLNLSQIITTILNLYICVIIIIFIIDFFNNSHITSSSRLWCYLPRSLHWRFISSYKTKSLSSSHHHSWLLSDSLQTCIFDLTSLMFEDFFLCLVYFCLLLLNNFFEFRHLKFLFVDLLFLCNIVLTYLVE